MTTPISNSTQEMCVICYEDYQDKEISNVNKIVELACHHFYHMDCISKSLSSQKDRRRDLTCCYCNQVIAFAPQNTDAFTSQEIFQARLKEIEEDCDYDSKVMESIPIVATLYHSLDAIVNQGEGVANSISDLVIQNEMIKEDLKQTVFFILSAMLLGEQFSRTVGSEAIRWKNVSFENWPDKIKQKGVLVRHKDIRIRISANHLKKIIDKEVAIDALMNHYQQKAEDFLQSVRFWAPRVLGVFTVAILAKKTLGLYQ